MSSPAKAYLSWLGIIRLGLVQTALGAIFVLSTSTLNRVMVVELALPAVLPGALITIHYALQLSRPWLGHGSDVGGRRTPWILGGMAVLALGGVFAAIATGLMKEHLAIGIAVALPAFMMIGLGVGAAGTALLVLIAKRTAPERRPAAATIAWVMMIMGFIVTAAIAGKTLDPFSPSRLVAVAAVIAGCGFLMTCLAVWGIEGPQDGGTGARQRGAFAPALREVWADPEARGFTLFIVVSMLAYGSEEFLIEPFAGATFGMTPAATAKLSGMLHASTLGGLVLVGLVATALRRFGAGALRVWMTVGCLGSACALVAIAVVGLKGAVAALPLTLVALGLSNGVYASAAIGMMMQLVGARGSSSEGVRMGLWGAAQAVALGGGGLVATVLIDTGRRLIGSRPDAYASVYVVEAAVFVIAAVLAIRLGAPASIEREALLTAAGRR